MGPRSAAAWVAAAAFAACTPVQVEKPKPPDVSDLRAAYEAPTGLLDDANAGEVVAALEERLVAGALLCGWDVAVDLACAGEPDCPLATCAGVTDLLDLFDDLFPSLGDDAGPGEEDAGTPDVDGVELRGEGFVRVTRICPGDGPEPVPDEDANGKLELVVGFTDRGLDPVVWGTADRCLVRVGESVRLQADVALVFGDGPWNPSDGISFLFRASGEATAESGRVTLETDFGLDVDREEVTVATVLADGASFVFFVGAAAAGFRDALGEWDCDFGAATCTLGGDSVSW